jgi:hypothetical protein
MLQLQILLFFFFDKENNENIAAFTPTCLQRNYHRSPLFGRRLELRVARGI